MLNAIKRKEKEKELTFEKTQGDIRGGMVEIYLKHADWQALFFSRIYFRAKSTF